MRKTGVAILMAGSALPMAATGQAPADAAAMKRLEAKVAPQSWYPEGYYDVRIAAEGQIAEAPRPISQIVFDWDLDPADKYKAYDVIDCGAEWVVPDDVDPVTARYGDAALEISRLRSELERIKFPLAAYAAPLLAYERIRVDEATKAPDTMMPELAAEDVPEAAADETDSTDTSNDPLWKLAAEIEANRKRLAPKLPHVLVDGGCGAGEGNAVIVKTTPPAGEVLLINAFAFKVCTRKQPNPWDRFACKWNEIETGVEKQLSGRYVYQVRWPDGTVRKGTREIIPNFDGDALTTETFKKTGS
ncbi:MAG: hypothetical protein Q7T68_06380 [Sphingopyxis sp.]|nr:hypothetical protein [Sphingopyxis sp.]